MLIQNGLIFDAVHPQPWKGDISIQNGVIAALAPHLSPAPGEEVIDASGQRVYPGFVDAHSHLGLDNYGMGYEGQDYNEMGDMVAAQLRGIDSFNPQDKAIHMALSGGVTTVGAGPGSANVLGGTFMAVKTWGNCVDDMVIKAPAAMKLALGENPKLTYHERHEGPITRMATAAVIRENLAKAVEYRDKLERALTGSAVASYAAGIEEFQLQP